MSTDSEDVVEEQVALVDTNEQRALFSRVVVDALAGLAWLTNAQRLDIATALESVFIAEPYDPGSERIMRESVESAANAVRLLDDQFRRTGLSELSRERMALTRAVAEINDIAEKSDPLKRSAGQLGWRKNEYIDHA